MVSVIVRGGVVVDSPAVTGQPRTWLRLEGLAALAVAIVVYRMMGGSWGLLAVLFLAPAALAAVGAVGGFSTCTCLR
jgi:hypothetical protein